MMKVQPASQNQIRQWRKLLRKKHRDAEGLFLVSGWNAVKEFLNGARNQVKEFIITKEHLDKLPELSADDQWPVFTVTAADFKRLSDEQHPQGIALTARIQAYAIDSEMPQENTLIYLDRVNDPGNLGTIVRSAVWFGLTTLLLSPESADPFQPKAVRASAGAIGRAKIYRGVDSASLKQLMRESGYSGVATVVEGGMTDRELRRYREKKTILVLGSEAAGLSPELLNICPIKISIPKPGYGESLNLSTAAAILFYLLRSG